MQDKHVSSPFVDVETTVEKIRQQLPCDFHRRLLQASLESAAQVGNPLRLNNFSTSFRELFRHVLTTYAPDKEVSACSWFVPDADLKAKAGITRAARIAYVVHGGLSPSYVAENLSIDMNDERKELISAIDKLSKFTHVEEHTFDAVSEVVDCHVSGACAALNSFLNLVHDAKHRLARGVAEIVEEAVVLEIISETIAAIDEISNKYSISYVSLDCLETTSVGSEFVSYEARGTLSVDLQWGSASDLRNGEGAEMMEDYPWSCSLFSSVQAPDEVEITPESLLVDTSSWWNDYYE